MEVPDGQQVGFSGLDGFSAGRPEVEQSGGVAQKSDRSDKDAKPLSAKPSRARVATPALSPDDLAGPGLTGANWFADLQQGVGQAFEPAAQAAPGIVAKKNAPASPLNAGVKANAIPSLPSFWSGLTCFLAVAGAGMIPRVRRAFLR
ncbi:MAG TPA: hypothetical protein VGI81_19650 [Tepidisphaeraceae bacterium]